MRSVVFLPPPLSRQLAFARFAYYTEKRKTKIEIRKVDIPSVIARGRSILGSN